MILRIDQTSCEPLYMQIRNQIVAAIARGELLAGDGLPSVRRLASDLGINLHTVNKAYAVLRDEGYLVMRGRSGAYVADEAHAASAMRRADTEEALVQTLQSLALEYKARGGSAQKFSELATRAAAEAFADPGIAGARRDVGVLRVDAEGNCLVSTGTNAGMGAVGFTGTGRSCSAGGSTASSAPFVPSA
ncbi:GntR family transcriptional regulator [Adlercreutzia sp. ZJ141]|uniref:GntR family transcriptional regulator n=1 Tax=Adlercreutzia sp. ZJ141 TaxID=2709406 RepID=UPI0013EA387A|nr:GntR family transcriptional regulator [Adlercreutzia sp. ZJ141]